MSRIKALVATAVSAPSLGFSMTPAHADTNTDDLSQALPEGATVQVVTTDPEALAQRAPTLTPQAIPTCAKGREAAWACFAANAMTCGAFTVAGGVPGAICEGVFRRASCQGARENSLVTHLGLPAKP